MSASSASSPPRPEEGEYAPYYQGYVSLVPEGDVLVTLGRQFADTKALLEGLSEEKAESRYEPGKWSIKELVGHMIDGERVFAYRALRISRGDTTPIEGFEQDDYVRAADFDSRTLRSLLLEFEHVRASTVLMLQGLGEEAWQRRGTANDSEVSVRAIAHIIAGHELHHVRILRERYL